MNGWIEFLFGIICLMLIQLILGVSWVISTAFCTVKTAVYDVNWTSYQHDFKDCITASNLGDIKSVGEFFTWFNKRPSNPIYRKLDRILCNNKWFSQFSEAQGHTHVQEHHGS